MKKIITLIVLAIISIATYAQLPSGQLKTLDGKTIPTDSLTNNGKPFAICFFATWCKPCNRELDAISEVYPDWQEETGMKIYAISTDKAQDTHKVKPMVDHKGWEYEVLLDANSVFLHALGITTIPHTLIIDGNGKIAKQHNGYSDGSEIFIIEEIKKLLEKKEERKN